MVELIFLKLFIKGARFVNYKWLQFLVNISYLQKSVFNYETLRRFRRYIIGVKLSSRERQLNADINNSST